MIIKNVNLDDLDMYEYQELIYTIIHYYNSLFHERITINIEEIKENEK